MKTKTKTDRKKKWIVVRHGSNSANQSCCNRAVVGVVRARTEQEAREAARAEWTCYNNQCLELIRPNEADYADKKDAAECDVLDVEEHNSALDAALADD